MPIEKNSKDMSWMNIHDDDDDDDVTVAAVNVNVVVVDMCT